VAAAAIKDGIKLKASEHDWIEAARLWGGLVGDPSAKKSPIIDAATKPLKKINKAMHEAYRAAKSRYDRLLKNEQRDAVEPANPRLIIGDTTTEAAQEAFKDSPNGILCHHDELSGFFGAMERYDGSGSDRAFWLTSYNGGVYYLDRIKRGSYSIPNLSACLLGGIQPDRIRAVAISGVDDGLLQRLIPITVRPAEMPDDTAPSRGEVERYEELIERLYEMEPPAGISFQGSDTVPLVLSPGAQAVLKSVVREHHGLVGALEAVNKKLSSAIGKGDGLFCRLCVVFHCIENAHAPALAGVVTEDTASRVWRFLRTFIRPHQFAFFAGLLGLADDHERLQAIAGFILAKKLTRVAHRDAQRAARSLRGLDSRTITTLYEQLHAFGWLERPDPRRSDGSSWLVNQDVHKLFAARGEAEQERRAAARKILTAMGAGGGSE
jgi:hypothetical protein